MTRLDWFEKGYGNSAVDLGILDPALVLRFIQYKVYTKYRAENKKTRAVELTAIEMEIPDSSVWRAVKFFEESTSL
jgi:hypothetical protein